MLQDVDLSLANWLGNALPPGTAVRFDTPQADWQNGRDTAFVSLFLCDIRRGGQETLRSGWSEVRENGGRLVGRQPAPRHYRVSYLATAWPRSTPAPQNPSRHTLEEHTLIGRLIEACSATDSITEDCLTGSLADSGLPTSVRCGDDRGRSVHGLWSGLGITPRAHLVLELTVPIVPQLETDLAPAPREIVLGAGRLGPQDQAHGSALPSTPTPSRPQPPATEEITRRRRRGGITEIPPRTDTPRH
ncbi:Pvc16 family protein [Kitasatospora sp. MBT63]|uniref:Pvc16 family protein n=1 Tax=Kitasatospora sp. MBT63 TaxID=1444768 RepID=UPI00053A3F94|nr:Pvc16 family protein [Kitasatospora sp. MBT63]